MEGNPNDANGRSSTRTGSTVAQSFAADLDSMFGLTAGSGDMHRLHQTVEEKKKHVNSGQSELEKLEAQIREAEQRLAKVSRHDSPSREVTSGAARNMPPNNNSPSNVPRNGARPPIPASQTAKYGEDRPTAGKRQDTSTLMAGMPGAMPPTPSGRDDFVMVDNSS